MKNNNTFKEILDIIKKSERILITAHVSPDGDAIGSGLATLLALNTLNKTMRLEAEKNNEIYIDKTIRFILEDPVPKNLKFLNHSDLIENIDNYSSKYEFDLVLCLDCGAFHRLGSVKDLITENSTSINIDHHISNDLYGNYNYLDSNASSTSEIIFDFLKESNISLDFDIAQSIYTGLVNDTGNFKHSNTTQKVFKIAGELLSHGVKPNEVLKEFFDSKSMAKMKLTGHLLKDFQFVDKLNLVYYYISQSKMDSIGATKDDTEGLVELLLSYEKASVSLLLKEDNGFIKGSFRSKNDVDVNAISNIFGGGGHIKAAGFKTDKSLDEVLQIVFNKMS